MHYCLFVKVHSAITGELPKRRRRDLNPRAAINDLHPFQGCPFSLLGTSPDKLIINSIKLPGMNLIHSQRREWDSNPRALADKRFSRPPRYDHFDISPNKHCAVCFPFSLSARHIISKKIPTVNNFFHFFSKKFSKHFPKCRKRPFYQHFRKKISATSRSSGVVILIFS